MCYSQRPQESWSQLSVHDHMAKNANRRSFSTRVSSALAGFRGLTCQSVKNGVKPIMYMRGDMMESRTHKARYHPSHYSEKEQRPPDKDGCQYMIA
jgi:hypothetical protein